MSLKNFMRFAPVVFALSTAPSHARVIEAANIEEATATVTPDTLLIFDIDNTIMMPAQMLGGEEWYDYVFEKYLNEALARGEPRDQAVLKSIDRALAEWNAVQFVTKVSPVEATAPGIIRSLQQKGVKTLGLTARPNELVAKTDEQLKSIGIDLGANTVSSKVFTLPGDFPTTFSKGVLFVGAKNNKGLELEKLLKKLGLKPKKIVFVDNKLKHVQNVEKVLASYDIDYLGCRHGAADIKIANFNPSIADMQYKYFTNILSNDKADTFIKLGL